MYENVSDLQLKALGYDDQKIREIRARSKSPTLEFRKGVDDLPPIGVDASGEAYFGSPLNAQAVLRRTPAGEGFEYDKDGGVRILPKGDDIELLKAQARPPVGPGTATPGHADWDTLQEHNTNKRLREVQDQFDPKLNPLTPETNARYDKMTAAERARALAAARQQRFKNENTRGLVDRNPQGARSTPWGQHPLDKERVPESRVAEPAVPPEDSVGAGEKAQWYANRSKSAPAGEAQPKSRLVVRGEEFDPNAEDPKMGWRTGSLKVSDAIARGDLAAARAMNERLPPSEQIPIPNRSVSAPVSPIGPSAEGLERIAESKRRKAAADQLITENAMANRASRRNRMGLVNPYISPEIRTLHRMGDDERDARTQMLNDKLALERERIAASQGTTREQLASQEKIAQGNLERDRNRDQAEADWRKQQSADALAGRQEELKFRSGMYESQLKEAQRQEAQAQVNRLLQQREEARRVYETQAQYAKNRPGDVDAADAAEQARRQLDTIDARIRSYDQNYQPVQSQFGSRGPDQAGQAGGNPDDYKRAWAAFNRHVQEDAKGNVVGMRAGSTPESIVKSIAGEMGTEWMRNPENEQLIRGMFARMPGGSDAYRIARSEEGWRDFWSKISQLYRTERDESWAPSGLSVPAQGLAKSAWDAGRSLPGGMGLPFWLPDIMRWANSQP